MLQADAEQIPLTALLASWRQGDGEAFAALFDNAYLELKKIAAQRLGQVHGAATLTPTELLHECVLRVMGSTAEWQNRAHFYASMSIYMRAVLVDHARARWSQRRGGGQLHLSLQPDQAGEESGIVDLLALDAALTRLEAKDQRCAAVLHLSCFAGLGRQEIAGVLDVSVQIVDRELRFAKSWLNAELDTRL